MTRRFDILETIRRKTSMSRDLGTKDPEYGRYAGGNFEIAAKLVIIDTLLETKLIPSNITSLVKLYRRYLNKQRKAYFASVGCSELSKLGLLLGMEHESISF